MDQKILYNCGDNSFSFAINGYFNGPNYELNPDHEMSEEDQFFNFTSKDMSETFWAPFNFSECQDSYSLPAVEDAPWHSHGDLVLICVNRVTRSVSTYSFDSSSQNLTLTNLIAMPMTSFLGAAIDMQLRRLLLFTNSTPVLEGSQ